MSHDDVLGGQRRCSASDLLNKDLESVTGLRAIVSSARESFETVDFASLMVATADALDLLEGDAGVREIEAQQCADKDGPAFEALRTRRICRISSTASSPCWPALRGVYRRHEIMSMASLPILLDGVAVAILNLYSRDYHAFGPAETRTAQRLVDQASLLIAKAMSSAGKPSDREDDVA